MAHAANLWQATRHGKQRRTPSRKEKAEKESPFRGSCQSARFALGSNADAEGLASSLRLSNQSTHPNAVKGRVVHNSHEEQCRVQETLRQGRGGNRRVQRHRRRNRQATRVRRRGGSGELFFKQGRS